MNILLVEDDRRVRRMIRLIVEHLADSIFECSDGAEACELYAVHRPDWVLMDLILDNLDGIEACRIITSRYPDARIVMVTSHDSEPLRMAAREAGARDYLLKENLTELPRLLV